MGPGPVGAQGALAPWAPLVATTACAVRAAVHPRGEMARRAIKRSEVLEHPVEGGERRLVVELDGDFVVVAEEHHHGLRTVRRELGHHRHERLQEAVGDYNRRLEQLIAAGWRGARGSIPGKIDRLELPGPPK